MARAIWKGRIRFGGVEVAVKLHAAVEDRSIRFHLLHRADRARVRQELVDPATDEPVDRSEARRGIEVEPGRFVVIDDDELAGLEPEDSRRIEIERFVPADAIGHAWYERPYWLSPDGDAKDYAALAAALERSGSAGIARWVMRKREYHGALRVERSRLALITLRHAAQVIEAAALDAPAAAEPNAGELKMADQLIEALETGWDPAAWRDEHRARVAELVATKAEGGSVKVKKFRPKPTADRSLGNLLEKSLERARKERRHA